MPAVPRPPSQPAAQRLPSSGLPKLPMAAQQRPHPAQRPAVQPTVQQRPRPGWHPRQHLRPKPCPQPPQRPPPRPRARCRPAPGPPHARPVAPTAPAPKRRQPGSQRWRQTQKGHHAQAFAAQQANQRSSQRKKKSWKAKAAWVGSSCTTDCFCIRPQRARSVGQVAVKRCTKSGVHPAMQGGRRTRGVCTGVHRRDPAKGPPQPAQRRLHPTPHPTAQTHVQTPA
jgi:hypothetical protein